MPDPPQFDHEKLEVYQLELRFIGWVTILLKEIKAERVSLIRETCDQLDRASLSALLNTAEGNGRRATKQRAKFFDDARGSGTECAACRDALVAKSACSKDRVQEGKAMLVRIVAMLSKLVQRFDRSDYGVGKSQIREDSVDWEFVNEEDEE